MVKRARYDNVYVIQRPRVGDVLDYMYQKLPPKVKILHTYAKKKQQKTRPSHINGMNFASSNVSSAFWPVSSLQDATLMELQYTRTVR